MTVRSDTSTPSAASSALMRRDRVVGRADAADAARDERRLVETAAHDHRLEEPRGFDDVHADLADLAPLDARP